MQPDYDALKNMINSLRFCDLQTLMGYVGSSKSGQKIDLQNRALEVLKSIAPHNLYNFSRKVKELYDGSKFHQRTSNLASNANDYNTHMVPTMHSQMRMQYIPQGNVPVAYNMQQALQNAPNQNMNYMSMYPNYSQQPKTISYVPQRPPHKRPQQRLILPQQVPLTTKNPPGCQYSPITRAPITFRQLPFHQSLDEIVKPTVLVPIFKPKFRPTDPNIYEFSMSFVLSAENASQIALNRDISDNKIDYDVQIILRIGAYESATECDDFIPVGLYVKVCGRPVLLPPYIPGQSIRRHNWPINISHQVKLCPTVCNTLVINWSLEAPKDPKRNYAIGIYVIKKQSTSELLKKLVVDSVIPAEITKQLIINRLKTEEDDDLATTSVNISLTCPLGSSRIKYPAKGKNCAHFMIFDAGNYISLNELKPNWLCPCCPARVYYSDLQIDEYFHNVLQSDNLPPDCAEIQVLVDGSWRPCINEEVYELDDSMDELDQVTTTTHIDNEEDNNNCGEAEESKDDLMVKERAISNVTPAEIINENVREMPNARVPEISDENVLEMADENVLEITDGNVSEIPIVNVPEMSNVNIPEMSNANCMEVTSANVVFALNTTVAERVIDLTEDDDDDEDLDNIPSVMPDSTVTTNIETDLEGASS